MAGAREGSLEAPTRHALDWKNPDFYDEDKLFAEMERVFDICHGCRRCVSLCQSFPVLFDLVDESDTMEVDGVAKDDYWKVVDQCYLCDLCFLTKCPYVPPHEWDLDFPHLMLQAKAVKYEQQGASLRDKTLTSTDRVGSLAGIPVVSGLVNALNRNQTFRGILEDGFGVHKDAKLPEYHSRSLRHRVARDSGDIAEPAGPTTGKVVLFATCYGNRNDPQSGEDLVAVFRHRHGKVLWDAQVRTRRPRGRGTIEGGQHPDARRPGRPGLGHRCAGALLRADVQAGTAVDVPGRPGCGQGA